MDRIYPHVFKLDPYEIDILFGNESKQPIYQEDLHQLGLAIEARRAELTAELQAELEALQNKRLKVVAKIAAWLNAESPPTQTMSGRLKVLREMQEDLGMPTHNPNIE